jgi:hypothetical protein
LNTATLFKKEHSRATGVPGNSTGTFLAHAHETLRPQASIDTLPCPHPTVVVQNRWRSALPTTCHYPWKFVIKTSNAEILN